MYHFIDEQTQVYFASLQNKGDTEIKVSFKEEIALIKALTMRLLNTPSEEISSRELEINAEARENIKLHLLIAKEQRTQQEREAKANEREQKLAAIKTKEDIDQVKLKVLTVLKEFLSFEDMQKALSRLAEIKVSE